MLRTTRRFSKVARLVPAPLEALSSAATDLDVIVSRLKIAQTPQNMARLAAVIDTIVAKSMDLQKDVARSHRPVAVPLSPEFTDALTVALTKLKPADVA